jgi:hypothetical protein
VIDPEDTDPVTGFEQGDEDEGFLARWSRRKQAGYQSREHPSAPGPQTESDAAPVADESQQVAARRKLTDADMPPLDTLNDKSDFAAFMSPGVSEKLRAQALRRLFHLPGFHVPDGLDDYDDDFTQFAKLGDIVTREMERMLVRERRAADAAEAASEPGQVDVESEAETVQKEMTDGMAGNAGDASSDGDEHSDQAGGQSSAQDLNHNGHQAYKGTRA